MTELMTTITTDELGTVTTPTETVASLLGKKFYSPKTLKVLPFVKASYRKRNVSGGRACIFSQSAEYKNRERQAAKDGIYRRF